MEDGTDNDIGEERIKCVGTAEPYAEPQNDVDTEMAKSKMENGKATEQGQITAELIKKGGKELKQFIYEPI
jgi:hypothetical protein